MNRPKLNYVIDIGLTLSFLAVSITGIIKFPGFLNILGITYNSVPKRQLSLIHDWSGLIMTALVLVHIILHWRWIISMTRSIFSRKKPGLIDSSE